MQMGEPIKAKKNPKLQEISPLMMSDDLISEKFSLFVGEDLIIC